VNFYNYALLYVGYTQLDTVPKEKLLGLAFDLGVAALVGDTIFNFGDLVCNLLFNLNCSLQSHNINV
jgi:hypothetical protein